MFFPKFNPKPLRNLRSFNSIKITHTNQNILQTYFLMALIRSKLHFAFPKSFIKPFYLPFSTVLESAKNPNVSQGEKETHEIDKGLNSVIKDHHKKKPKFYRTPENWAINWDNFTVPSLADSFSQITPGECISPSVVVSVIKKCRYTRAPIPFAQALAFFKWAINWDNFEIYKQAFVDMVDLLGKAQRFDVAYDLIGEMESRKLDIPSEIYVRLARRYVKAGYFEGGSAINWMEKHGCIHDHAAISVVIATFVHRGRVTRAQSFFDSLKDSFELNVVDYNNLIKGWCRAGIIPRAERVFREMKRNGIVPNVYTYTVLIDGLCRHGKITRAHYVLSEMIEKGCQPNAATFNSLLSVHVKFGTTDKVLQVYNQMKRLGCQPDVITYNFLIECHCRDGNRDDAMKLIHEMVDKGIVPNTHSFNLIFNCISQVGDVNGAHTLFAKMKELKCQPNVETYNALMRIFVESKLTDMVWKLIDEMEELEIELNVETYKIVISVLCAMGDWSEACEFFEEMIEETNLKPRMLVFEAYDMVLKELRIAGQTKKHEEVVNMMNTYLK